MSMTLEDQDDGARVRRSWLLSMPAIIILLIAAVGPLFILSLIHI